MKCKHNLRNLDISFDMVVRLRKLRLAEVNRHRIHIDQPVLNHSLCMCHLNKTKIHNFHFYTENLFKIRNANKNFSLTRPDLLILESI